MTVSHLISLAEEVERYLGDPHDPSSRMSYQRILEHDESERYPHELVDVLHEWGLHTYLLPEEWGGRAIDVEVGFNLLRLVARRDPAAATAVMLTDLAFMPAWIAGTAEQREGFVRAITDGTKMAWGLSERHHGSDVLANEMRAEKVPGGYLLSGEKYLIGNATVSDVVSLQARTDERGGPGGWSLFAVDKRECAPGTFEHLPRERLHGLRASDLGGFRLDQVFVPESSRFGEEGRGLEISIKGAQVARISICSMSLGAVDTALRLAMDFAEQREIFGRKVVEIPYSRRQLAECFADLLIGDALCTEAVRGLQGNPAQASVFSSVVKYFVPTLLERTMAQTSVVLGARLYLRDHPHFGVYQKMMRDVLVAIFADGNTVVNLKNIALELHELLGTSRDPGEDLRAAAEKSVGLLYDVDAKLPRWQPQRQSLFSRGKDDTVLAMPDGIERLRALAERQQDPAQRQWYLRSAEVAQRLMGQLDRLHEGTTRLKQQWGKEYSTSDELFRLGEQYCAVHAGAALVHLVTRSAEVLQDPMPDGAVLLLCLERVWRQFRSDEPVTDVDVIDRVVEVLRWQHGEHRLFSHWQFRLRASSS
ncbi:acyl-CoA dehydrogenase family protein [Saccharopolyspora erythraea]|uniref:acyl-CoA dehydrogenase family protein n=1 Tax=Saccharopolyspora erythraea TaxID=1836 RepID=UPI001BAD6C62|nr:acyl-CoA dehydrogenase family protein [Saccharopolyspora erythraea]QUG99408.1 acyl-CoA dehydrogenase family protein [Saccharopolyspora erythraea]